MLATAPVGAAQTAAEKEEQIEAARAACESLNDLELPNTTITAAEFIVNEPIEEKPGIVVYGPDWKSPQSAHGQASVPVPFCRVTGR